MNSRVARPRVSIGLPVYNGEAHLREALASLVAQTFTDFEVLIGDNCSTDTTGDICRELVARDSRFHYVRNDENLGAAPNFNAVFGRAQAPYFKWFGHDDVLEPQYLERCVALLDADPEASVAFARVRYIDNDGAPLSSAQSHHLRGGDGPFDDISLVDLLRMPQSAAPMFVFGLTRTSLLRQTGLIRSYAESDLTLVAELRMLGKFREVPEPLFVQRIHHNVATRKARGSVAGETAWFDPRARAASVPSGLHIFREYLRLVLSHSGDAAELANGLAATMGYAEMRGRTAIRRLALARWSALTVAMVRDVGERDLPLRLWSALVGVRERDASKIRMAAAPSSSNVPLRLFGAWRIGKRNEANAEELLAHWLDSEDPDARLAAALVASQMPGRYGRVFEASAGESLDERLGAIFRDQRVRVQALREGVLQQLGMDVDAVDRFAGTAAG